MKLLWIAIAGALGTLARYWLGGKVQRMTGGSFPWGTMAVNLSGCFVFGILWALAVERFNIGGELRIIVLLGFMGAFTTFSTLVFESAELLRASQWLKMGLNLAGQNFFGFVALYAGIVCGRVL